MRRDSPPCRETSEEIAGDAVRGPDLAGTLRATDGGADIEHAASGQLALEPCWWDGGQISQTLDAVLNKGQSMPERNRFPAVLQPLPFDTTQLTHPANRSNPKPGDPCHALAAGAHPPAIAFGANDHGHDNLLELSPTLRAGNGVHANAGTPPAIAFKPSHYTRGKDGAPSEVFAPLTKEADRGDQEAVVFVPDVCPTLRAGGNSTGGDRPPGTDVDTADSNIVDAAMQVRRLLPVECERLQGFPDHYTKIPTWNGWRKMAEDETPEECIELGMEVKQNLKTKRWRVKDVDGPRYKALGNSWPVTVPAWIGARIDKQLEALANG